MWNKIWTRTKEWFSKNWKSFSITLTITLGGFFFISFFTKWSVLVVFLLALIYKIWKNQPF